MKHVSHLGLFLFLLYCVLYFGFVLVNAFQPQWMESRPLFGLNLSITYGFGLIIAAFVLALVYGWFGSDLSSQTEASSASNDEGGPS